MVMVADLPQCKPQAMVMVADLPQCKVTGNGHGG